MEHNIVYHLAQRALPDELLTHIFSHVFERTAFPADGTDQAKELLDRLLAGNNDQHLRDIAQRSFWDNSTVELVIRSQSEATRDGDGFFAPLAAVRNDVQHLQVNTLVTGPFLPRDINDMNLTRKKFDLTLPLAVSKLLPLPTFMSKLKSIVLVVDCSKVRKQGIEMEKGQAMKLHNIRSQTETVWRDFQAFKPVFGTIRIGLTLKLECDNVVRRVDDAGWQKSIGLEASEITDGLFDQAGSSFWI
ncbi:hypothetical protein LTR85_009050 [Meristemomyces frigidus]|nr:hypothetical protein LTR85_009050 [Meristemomyces frigidus]